MAKVKICLDAGHYGRYNVSPVVPEYYESDMTWALHLLLRQELEKYGVEVITTREEKAKDKALYDRGRMARGCDLFISIHSNAVGGKVGNENVDRVDVYAPLDGRAHDIATKLGAAIRAVMGTKDGHYVKTRRGSNGDYYGVIRGAVSVGVPGLLIEHSFHSNSRSARWLLKQENLARLAKAEAEVLAEHYGLKKAAGEAEKLPQDIPAKDNDVPTTGTAQEVPFIVRVAIEDLRIRKGPGTNYEKTGRYTGEGAFTIVEVRPGEGSEKGWGLLKSEAGWIALDAVQMPGQSQPVNRVVRVSTDDVAIYTGPGTNYEKTGRYTGEGAFTIVQVQPGEGSAKGWGKLKSGAGWISLDYAEKE